MCVCVCVCNKSIPIFTDEEELNQKYLATDAKYMKVHRKKCDLLNLVSECGYLDEL